MASASVFGYDGNTMPTDTGRANGRFGRLNALRAGLILVAACGTATLDQGYGDVLLLTGMALQIPAQAF